MFNSIHRAIPPSDLFWGFDMGIYVRNPLCYITGMYGFLHCIHCAMLSCFGTSVLSVYDLSGIFSFGVGTYFTLLLWCRF